MKLSILGQDEQHPALHKSDVCPWCESGKLSQTIQCYLIAPFPNGNATSTISTLEGNLLCQYAILHEEIGAQIQVCTSYWTLTWVFQIHANGGKEIGSFVPHFFHTLARGHGEKLVVDGNPNMAYKEWKKTTCKFCIVSPWQNKAEIVRDFKQGVSRFTKRTGSVRHLWCLLGEVVSVLQGFTAYDSRKLQGRCPMERALGTTCDILLWLQHGYYNNMWLAGDGSRNF
jgi:hypothetical protein